MPPKFNWADIVTNAGLSFTELAVLRVCDYEQKRKVIWLRIPHGLALPPSIWNKVADSANKNGYTLKKGEKWPTVADLADAVSDLEWLWTNWIPKGFLTMLAGSPGTGKSTLAHWFIKIVVDGGKWPDGTIQKPQPVVMIETEAAQVLLNKHFRDMQIPAHKVYMPGFDGDMLSQPDLSKEDHRQRVLQLCEEKRPALVVLDSIGGAHTKGENRIEDVRPMMEFLAMLARDYDCSTLALHHLKKRSNEFDAADLRVDDVRGSSAITAFTRSLLGISFKKGKRRVLEVVKSNVAEISNPYELTFNQNPKGNVCAIQFDEYQEDVKQTQFDLCTEWLQNLLQSNRSMPVNGVMDEAKDEGFTRRMVFDVAHRMELAGELVRTGHGKNKIWSLFTTP